MSNIVYVTVPLPILLLIVMLLRVVFLDGAGDGIEEYLWPKGDDKFSPLKERTIWSEAIG